MKSLANRNGVTTLEAIIAVPILLIAILGIVELGFLSSNQMVVQAASRAGADAAAALGCDLPAEGDVPAEILSAVSNVLSCENVSAMCVRVEHTIGDTPPYVLIDGTGASPPAGTAPTTTDYVCVSVCVENSELAPNLLRTFCIDLEGTFSQKSVCRCTSCESTEEDEDECDFSIMVQGEGPEVTATVGTGESNGWNLYSDGQLFFNVDLPEDCTYTFCARLWASRGGPDLANAAFIVDGVQIADFDIAATTFDNAEVHCVDVPLSAGNHQFAVAFTNDFFDAPIDRNLFVDYMSVDAN